MSVIARIRRGDVLVGDGAWGTMLMARGLAAGTPPEAFVLERPAVIREVARLYRDAGADLITTNTFGATTLNLAAYGLESRAAEINRTAVALAREAAADAAYVSASVGPTARILAPLGDTEPERVAAAFEEQMRVLAEAGADLICIETMTDAVEAALAVEAAKRVAPQLPVVATMTFDATPRGFFTIMGVSISCIRRRPRRWRPASPTCSPPASSSSEAAAGRRLPTSARSEAPSTRAAIERGRLVAARAQPRRRSIRPLSSASRACAPQARTTAPSGAKRASFVSPFR